MCTVDHIKRHFVEAYASPICVSAVTLAYDVSDLEAVAEELRDARSAKKYAQNYKDKNPGAALTMKPKVCSRCCSFFCCCVDRVKIDNLSKKKIKNFFQNIPGGCSGILHRGGSSVREGSCKND